MKATALVLNVLKNWVCHVRRKLGRAYRGLLVGAPGIDEYVSGMILFDETLRQATDAVPVC